MHSSILPSHFAFPRSYQKNSFAFQGSCSCAHFQIFFFTFVNRNFFTGWGGCRERNMPKFCFCSLYTRTYRYEGEGHTDNDVLVFSLKIGFPFKAKSCEMILYSRNFSLFRFLFVFRKHFVWHVSLPSFFAKCLLRNFMLQNLYCCYIFGTVFAVIWAWIWPLRTTPYAWIWPPKLY